MRFFFFPIFFFSLLLFGCRLIDIGSMVSTLYPPNWVALACCYVTFFAICSFSKAKTIYFAFQMHQTKKQRKILYLIFFFHCNSTVVHFVIYTYKLCEKLQLLRETAKLYALRSSSSQFLLKC